MTNAPPPLHELESEVMEALNGDAALVHFARHMGRLDRKRRDQLRRLARDAQRSQLPVVLLLGAGLTVASGGTLRRRAR